MNRTLHFTSTLHFTKIRVHPITLKILSKSIYMRALVSKAALIHLFYLINLCKTSQENDHNFTKTPSCQQRKNYLLDLVCSTSNIYLQIRKSINNWRNSLKLWASRMINSPFQRRRTLFYVKPFLKFRVRT
jgi:hypothetical protein